jgi:hypothetical protein
MTAKGSSERTRTCETLPCGSPKHWAFEYFVSVADVFEDIQSDHAATDHPPPERVVAAR